MNRISFQKLYFYLLAILILRLDLISLNTMPTGGDMGAHVVPIKYFIDNFALNFQLNGWSIGLQAILCIFSIFHSLQYLLFFLI
jgi:hypothetical protein